MHDNGGFIETYLCHPFLKFIDARARSVAQELGEGLLAHPLAKADLANPLTDFFLSHETRPRPFGSRSFSQNHLPTMKSPPSYSPSNSRMSRSGKPAQRPGSNTGHGTTRSLPGKAARIPFQIGRCRPPSASPKARKRFGGERSFSFWLGH